MLKKRDAKKIATKLNADIKNGKHQWAKFSIDGKPRKFSIRHGSQSDHSHLVNDLALPLRKIQQLAQCSMTATEYYEPNHKGEREPTAVCRKGDSSAMVGSTAVPLGYRPASRAAGRGCCASTFAEADVGKGRDSCLVTRKMTAGRLSR